MKKLGFFILCLLILGCEPPTNKPSNNVQEEMKPPVTCLMRGNEGTEFSLTKLEKDKWYESPGDWRIVEVKHRGKTHVILQNYDSDSQGMIKIDEY